MVEATSSAAQILGADQESGFDWASIMLASPDIIRSWSYGRGQEPGDHQLPHVQAGEGRPVLRAHLRSDQGLGMQLRQVQAHQAQGRHLRPLRRRGDPGPRAPRAHGPHRAGRARVAHLVLQVHAQPHGPGARHHRPQPGARAVLRGLRRRGPGRHAAAGEAAAERDGIPRGPGQVRRGLRGQDGRRGRPRADEAHRPGEDHRRARGRDGDHAQQADAQEADQAHQGAGGVPAHQHAARVDDPRVLPVIPPDLRPLVPAGGRPVRHLRPERPLPPRHQPQQPPAQPAAAEDARRHHPQREAHAAGGGGRPLSTTAATAAPSPAPATAR
jgi:hypothetical protein